MSRIPREEILVIMTGLLLSACDKSSVTPQAEPSSAAVSGESASNKTGADSKSKLAATEVPAAKPSASAKGEGDVKKESEKTCSPGGCAPGACG